MHSADGIDVNAGLAWATAAIGEIAQVRELSGGSTSTMLALTPVAGEDVVLRLMTREPWRTHGRGLTSRESEIQQLLAGGPVPAPRSRALDARGRTCGHPAHLMTRLPGEVDLGRVDRHSLARLAQLLATIHDVRPSIDVRDYQSWAWEAKYVVPPWSSEPRLWEEAFALLRGAPPAFDPRFIHRDFQLRNVLWCGGEISGVVDWVETSIGPAWLDVAHCCTNLALDHGSPVADLFAAAYVACTGRAPQPYFDVMDVVGFLPPPGRKGFIESRDQQQRLEERLRTVLSRLRATAAG